MIFNDEEFDKRVEEIYMELAEAGIQYLLSMMELYVKMYALMDEFVEKKKAECYDPDERVEEYNKQVIEERHQRVMTEDLSDGSKLDEAEEITKEIWEKILREVDVSLIIEKGQGHITEEQARSMLRRVILSGGM